MFQTVLTAAGLFVVASIAQAQGPTIPPGYSATVFYQDGAPGPLTGLATDAQGRLYCVSQGGVVRRLTDSDGDGAADVVEEIFDGAGLTPSVTGILWGPYSLFVSHRSTISRLVDTNGDDVLDQKVDLVTDLPYGWHQNNGLFGDAKRIYFGLGSTTDFMAEPDPMSATLMVYDTKLKTLQIASDGLRNVFDGAIHPVTGDIIVGDNGPNTIQQMPHPPDEINRIRGRKHYGHPFNWGPPRSDVFQAPLLLVPPHASPCGMAINENVGMSGYRNEAVLATLGAGQSAIVKLPLIYSGAKLRSWYSPFATGFTTAIDVVFDDDGAMYVAEFATSTVYRIQQVGTTTLVIEGQPSIGHTCAITLSSPTHAGYLAYPAASSGLIATPINLGAPGLDIYLNTLSPLFAISTSPSAKVFEFPQPTLLDAAGRAQIKIHIPNDSALVGVEIYVQASVWDPLTIVPVDVSPPQPFRILSSF
jgi:glucose/arabinose dehydrogenase